MSDVTTEVISVATEAADYLPLFLALCLAAVLIAISVYVVKFIIERIPK